MQTATVNQHSVLQGPAKILPNFLPPVSGHTGAWMTEAAHTVNYKIAGSYLNEADAVTALDYLQAKGYPNDFIDLVSPGHPLPQQKIIGDQNAAKSDDKKLLVQAMVALGLFVAASAIVGQIEGTLWGSTSLTLGIMGFTTIVGGSSMLFHGKPIKELQFEKIISRYAKKKYWTLLVYADHERLARFALRLIERTSCRNAFVCGPAPIK